ncbi:MULTISPECIES: hypothetical protein [Streptomyces]|uniref:hypothetical protein n=1 Tax=Streptomyces TaxID=1883 RepID=UPI000BF224FA|nr:hypothetical protein [Streptomyces sp. wa1063]WTE08775.1 hypothetical protein OH765_40045 [Streptomyces anulatus]WTE31777.1 hypothetical protein OHB50_39890 [Streptomyces anulatus]
MSEETDAAPPRTAEDLRTLALQLAADAVKLRDELADFGRPMPADMLARVVALDHGQKLLVEWATDLAVQQVTVPDFPPRDLLG